MSKTLFEKIVAREIPATIIYEDDLVFCAARHQSPGAEACFGHSQKSHSAPGRGRGGRPAAARSSPSESRRSCRQTGVERKRLPAGHQQRRGWWRDRAAPARSHSRWPPHGLAAGVKARWTEITFERKVKWCAAANNQTHSHRSSWFGLSGSLCFCRTDCFCDDATTPEFLADARKVARCLCGDWRHGLLPNEVL